MSHPEGKRPVTIVSAVMRRNGLPDFAITQVVDGRQGAHVRIPRNIFPRLASDG